MSGNGKFRFLLKIPEFGIEKFVKGVILPDLPNCRMLNSPEEIELSFSGELDEVREMFSIWDIRTKVTMMLETQCPEQYKKDDILGNGKYFPLQEWTFEKVVFKTFKEENNGLKCKFSFDHATYKLLIPKGPCRLGNKPSKN